MERARNSACSRGPVMNFRTISTPAGWMATDHCSRSIPTWIVYRMPLYSMEITLDQNQKLSNRRPRARLMRGMRIKPTKVRRRNTLVSEGIDSLSPCRHTVSTIPVVMNLMRRYGAAMTSRRAYIMLTGAYSTNEDAVAFKPNYGRDRAERARAARARSEEKQRKKDEKIALRKAQRAEVGSPTDKPTFHRRKSHS
jgi:hypothetical protein